MYAVSAPFEFYYTFLKLSLNLKLYTAKLPTPLVIDTIGTRLNTKL